jgi:hypothetical protein
MVAIFGLGLGTAILGAVALALLGPVGGAAVCAVLLVAVFHRKGAAGVLSRQFPSPGPANAISSAPAHASASA